MSESAARSALFAGKGSPRQRRARRRRRWVVALVVVFLWLALNAAFAWLLLHPRRVKPFLRFEDVADTQVDAVAKPMKFVTSDGVMLDGVAFVPPAPRGVVLLFHGYGGSRFDRMARRVATWGYVGVAADFRAHGASEGDCTTVGYDERHDVEAVATEARAAWPKLKTAGWGMSMGGAALIYAAETSKSFNALILESVYADIDSAFERRIETILPSFLTPLAWPAKKFAQLGGGLDCEAMRPDREIAKLVGAKTLITTGEKDPWATTDDLRKLSEALPGSTTKVVAGAHHHDVWKVGGDDYLAFVRAFLDARLR